MKKKYLLQAVFLFFFSSLFFCQAQNADISMLRELNLNRNQSLDRTFQFISDSDVPIAIGIPVVLYAAGMINKDAILKKKALFVAETFVVSSVITLAMKYSIRRERPYVTYPELDKQSSGGGYSFPSGHTSAAFATATSLSMAFPKWYVVAPSFVWASAVGYSRVHLGVHYPTDILAGALVGSGSAYLTYKLNNWINKKRNKTTLFDNSKAK